MTDGQLIVANASLRRSLAVQWRVIRALLMREVLTRYGRHNIGFMWLFLEPMMFTLGVIGLVTVAKGASGGILPIVPFAIVGYSTILMWRNSASRCAGAVENNIGLLYHRNVMPLDLYASRLLLEISGGTVSFVLLSLVAIAGGWMDMPADLPTMLSGWILLAWFSIALGLCVGALSFRSEGFSRVWHVLTYLLFPLSGALFMVEWFPQPIREQILWIPMINFVEMLRDGYYGEAVRTHYSVSYMLLVNMGMLLVGLQLVHQNKKLVTVE